jgi:hypothetical protein
MLRKTMLGVSVLLVAACGSKAPEPTLQAQSTAQADPGALPVLRAPLDELRTWFDSHRGEARFIAVLSPT